MYLSKQSCKKFVLSSTIKTKAKPKDGERFENKLQLHLKR